MTESKKDIYELLLKELDALLVKDIPLTGNLCNLLAQIKKRFNHFWVGLYIRQENNTLGLGPFQGEPACTVIQWGKGVCGTAAAEGKTVIVDDVLSYPNYIACHPEPRSEIVVPGFINGEVAFVLDVDSVYRAYFDDTDKHYLENAVLMMAMLMKEGKSLV